MGEGILIDTDYLIEYVKGRRELPPSPIYYISEVTIYEFIRGTKDVRQAKKMIEEMFSILWVDNEILELSARIWIDLRKRGEILDDRDIVIGSTSIAKEVSLLTLNRKHFEKLKRYGLELL